MIGTADIMIAGGGESYSQLYSKFSMATEPYKLIPPTPIPQKLAPIPEDDCDMITTAESIATMYGITRQECDEFAYQSQMRAAEATAKIKLKKVLNRYTKNLDALIY